jgi:hypothetical protein
MSDTQGVLLRYAGGEVYALPTAEPHVWRVAGIEVHVGIVATHPVHNTVIGLETTAGLAESAERRRRMAAEVATNATSKSKQRGAAKGGR